MTGCEVCGKRHCPCCGGGGVLVRTGYCRECSVPFCHADPADVPEPNETENADERTNGR